MEGNWRDDEIVVGGNARQQLFDARGFGRPQSGSDIALTPVEAAYLLATGDLESVDGDGFLPFVTRFFRESPRGSARYLTYADLRQRGYYLSPARDGWVDTPEESVDFVVYPRGSGPRDGEVAHRVRVVTEQSTIPATDLGDVVLSIVDGEGEVTYLETTTMTMAGSWSFDPPTVHGQSIGDRVLVTDPPQSVYHEGFFGQPIEWGESDHALQLSVIEAAHLEDRGRLDMAQDAIEDLRARSRDAMGSRFDRLLSVYSALRSAGVVPKTGLKFGADFRTYTAFSSVDDLGHSDHLVQVHESAHAFTPQELAHRVRLAHGVRKRTVFALTDASHGVTWLSVTRLTP